MAAATTTDLTNIILLFANFTFDNILTLSNNAAYKFTPPSKDADPNEAWRGRLTQKPRGPMLCLEFGKGMFNPDGWVLGSAPDDDAASIAVPYCPGQSRGLAH
ncbi:hypothetical protein SCUP515_10226 [Seiridium cupressi]